MPRRGCRDPGNHRQHSRISGDLLPGQRRRELPGYDFEKFCKSDRCAGEFTIGIPGSRQADVVEERNLFCSLRGHFCGLSKAGRFLLNSHMSQTFTHPLWKRVVTVDDDGIHEHRRGRPFLSIRWDEIEVLNRDCVRSERGARIGLRLTPQCRREFAECASAIWRQRYPDRWHRNLETGRRKIDRAVYFWLPLLTLGPCLVGYVFFWLMGWPESLRPEIQKIHHLTILGIICVVATLIWYRFRKRSVR